MRKRVILILLGLSILFSGCQQIISPSIPDIVVTTYDPVNVGIASAVCGGDVVTNIQGLTLSYLGICWSENRNPTINDSGSSTEQVSECFVYEIKGLKPNTKYYVRAFALRGTQPYYGEEKEFQTLDYAGINVITKDVTDVTSSTVQVRGNVVSDGGVPVETRGFCWSTSTLPTLENDFKVVGSGLGEYSFTIQGLSPGTTYYFRSFAKNTCGVYYGQVLSFITSFAFNISIDGVFSDWDKLDASKVSTAKCDPLATKTALKLVRVCADDTFVYVYFEWDKSQISHEPDVEHVPFHCYLNTDGNPSTGGFADLFSDACTDIMMEGFIYPDGARVGSYAPIVCEWTGNTNGSGWNWGDIGEFGTTFSAGIDGQYEFRISRQGLLKKLADNFSIGFDIQQGWESVGVLPNSHVTADNPSGLAPSLQVYTVR